ncbi:MAG TPA: porin [Tepidisphaeraceae bacterium]|nr:porin [Tepidisphaeraceae bacterium]
MKGDGGIRGCVFTSILAAAISGVPVYAAATAANSSSTTESPQQMMQELRELKAEVQELRQEVQHPTKEQVDAVVREMNQDVQQRGKFSLPEVGYDNGFFITTPDNNFSLHIGGYTQFRYTFARDNSAHNAADFATPPKTGDASGFDFRYARLYFTGHAFSPNLTYMIEGDFAGDSGNSNDFQLVDNYIAWRFNDTFNVRMGSYLVPYSRVEYISSGLAFVDWPSLELPFDPVRSFGVSLYGEPVKDKLTYEFMVNNGPNANHNGRAAQVGGLTDNRFGLATRWQLFGGTGKPSDFDDESDLRKDKSTLAWMLGAAVGYDSINQSASAFPGGQKYTIPGVSSIGNPGFTTYPANGDIYRATIDGEIKYQGWEFTGATYFEQINETSATGITLPTGYGNKLSFYNIAYYGQVGYMFLPKWEVVGRAGQFYTEGGANHEDEFSLGLNYFIFGHHAKLQGDLTYIPNALVTNSTDGTSQSTDDLIARLQMQLKF